MQLDLLIQFSIDGDLAYLSHLDSLRLWRRLLRRAGWPLRFSEGFNVRPRLALLLPRPVGTPSDDERLRVGLVDAAPDAACGVAALRASLAAVLPDGLALRNVSVTQSKAAFRVVAAEYVATLPDGCRVEPEAVDRFLADEHHLVRRDGPRGSRPEKDIRPFVEHLSAVGSQVHMRLSVTDAGSTRPTEVLPALGVDEAALPEVSIRRTRTLCAADGGPQE